MLTIEQQLKTYFHTASFCAYVIIKNGGGTGNEAAAFRLGRYLQLNLGMQVKYLLYPANSQFKTCDTDEDSKLVWKDQKIEDTDSKEVKLHKQFVAKCIKLGIKLSDMVKTREELMTTKSFIYFSAADSGGSNNDGEAKGLVSALEYGAKLLGKKFDVAQYYGYVNFTPYAWKSDGRSIINALSRQVRLPINMPVRAVYPQPSESSHPQAISPNSGISVGPHKLVNLMDKFNVKWDTAFTYGLHALYDAPADTNEDEANGDYSYVYHGAAILFIGYYRYMVNHSKKHTLMMAMHPRNKYDEPKFPESCLASIDSGVFPKKVKHDKSITECLNLTSSLVHFIDSDHPNLANLIASIEKAKCPQLVVVQRSANETIPPNDFNKLIEKSNLPIMSEGANTVGQLISSGKALFTIGDPKQQLPCLYSSLERAEAWQEALIKEYKLQPPSKENSEALEKLCESKVELESISKKTQEALGKIRGYFMSGESEGSIDNGAKLIEDGIKKDITKEYIDKLVEIEDLFISEVFNQVVLGITYLFKDYYRGLSSDDDINAISDILIDAHVYDRFLIKKIQLHFQQGKPYKNKSDIQKQMKDVLDEVPDRVAKELVSYLMDNIQL